MQPTSHRRRQRSCVLIAILLGCASLASSTESRPLSTRLGVDELQAVPADTLAAWVVDLTWLVEDLKAEAARREVLHQVDVDTLQRRIDYLRMMRQVDEDSRPSMLETYLVPVAMTAGVLIGAWAATR